MFTGISIDRMMQMTSQEKRRLDNIKKAFYESDRALQSGEPEDRCLEEIFKAIDAAVSLRKSLRGETYTTSGNNKRLFSEFIALEVPAARQGSLLRREHMMPIVG